MKFHWNALKDPWKLFTLFALVILFLLVIVSQVWIFRSSLQREGGTFTVKTFKNGKTAELEEETVAGFQVEREAGEIRVHEGAGLLYSLSEEGPGRMTLQLTEGSEPDLSESPEGGWIVSSETGRLWISQNVFSGLFDDVSRQKRLELRTALPGKVEVLYEPGAFLQFSDRDRRFTLGNYLTFLSRSRYLGAIRNSFTVMILSTLIGGFFGVGLAYLLARYKVPGTSLLITIITMASISPPFLGAYAWRMLLGSSGILTRALGLTGTIVGIHGVIWVISWLVFPVVFLLTYDAFTSLDHSLRECSMSLGGTRRVTFFRVELPLAMPGIINGLYMAMMTAFTDFGTPYVISLDLNVLPVMIYKEYMSEVGGNLSIASTGSMLMILFSSVILMAQRVYLAKRSYASVKTRQPSARMPGNLRLGGIYGAAGMILLFAFIPHITVVVSAFFDWSAGVITARFTLGNFIRLFHTSISSVGVTLFTGLAATLLNFIFGLGIAYVLVKKRYPVVAGGLNLLVMVPYLIPGTVLGLGFILIFNQPPLLLTGTWVILVLAYFVRKLPYSVKSAESALYQVHPSLEEAARSLGAGPIRSFIEITFPLILGGVISGATLSFLQIMTEISSTIILYRPPWKPMTAVIFENTIDAGADFGLASAMTVLLMAMLYIPLYFVTVKARKIKEVRIESL